MLTTVFLVLCGLPFILGPIWFFFSMLKSVTTNVKTLGATKADTVDVSLSREARNARLKSSISPPQEYVLAQGEISLNEAGQAGVPGLLDAFERSIIQTPHTDISLAVLKGGSDAKNSFLIVYRATPTIGFLGWLVVYQTGMAIQWKVKAAEVRSIRSPDVGNSHFNYTDDHEKRLYNAVFKRTDDDNGLGVLWDIATGNVMTDANAKKASWFRDYLLQRFNDALSVAPRLPVSAAQSGVTSPQAGYATLQEQPNRRD